MSAEPKAELGKLRTEQVDEKFHLLDIMSIGELLKAMNESDGDVPRAIALQLPSIERAIDAIAHFPSGEAKSALTEAVEFAIARAY